MTELLFLGTRGEIEESTEKHRFHSSLLLTSGETRILIDYGELHRYSLEEINPNVVIITHAHPDHYVWLNQEVKTPTPVYLTQETLEYGKFVPENHRVIKPNETFEIPPFKCMPYRVLHSIRCPAIGYKIFTPDKVMVYNSDLVDIVDRDNVLRGVDYYIGDGSALRSNLVRRRGDQIFGHTRITTQINWCKKYGISNIIFTHLGKETIRLEDDFRTEFHDIILAYDGMETKI